MATVTTPTIPTPIPIPNRSSPVPEALAVAPDPLTILMASRHRITREEYRQIAHSGVFGPESRIELIEGILVDKMTKNSPHAFSTAFLNSLFNRLLSREGDFSIWLEGPISIDARQSEPEPDVVILRGTLRSFEGRMPTPADAALIVEVSDSSYAIDRNVKSAIYAVSAVPTCWIVDLNRRRLEVLTKPTPPREGGAATYEEVRLFEADDEVPLMLDGRDIGRFAVREILP